MNEEFTAKLLELAADYNLTAEVSTWPIEDNYRPLGVGEEIKPEEVISIKFAHTGAHPEGAVYIYREVIS